MQCFHQCYQPSSNSTTHVISTELTIQKQLATCDLTNDLTKLGYSCCRFDWTSSARIKADDKAPPRPSNVCLPILELQVKHINNIVIKYINKSQTEKIKLHEYINLRWLTDLAVISTWFTLNTSCPGICKISH